jgi:Bacterial pre-peptidase C-terminal domain
MNGLSGDADVYLLNTQGAEVAHSYNTGTAAESIDVVNLAAGTYYVQVKPYGMASTDYMLSMSAAPVATPPDLAGNTLATARAISVGPQHSAYDDFVGPNDTFDYYKFTIGTTAHLTATMNGLAADADLYLLNSAGTDVAHSYNSNSTPELIDMSNFSAGTYYLEVHSYNNAATNYHLDLVSI